MCIKRPGQFWVNIATSKEIGVEIEEDVYKRQVESMLRFAMLAEETSASKYREFASLATSPGAREALERIASEEDRHLSELRTQG